MQIPSNYKAWNFLQVDRKYRTLMINKREQYNIIIILNSSIVQQMFHLPCLTILYCIFYCCLRFDRYAK